MLALTPKERMRMFKRLFLLTTILAIFVLPLHAQTVTQTIIVGTGAVNVVAATNGITSIEVWQSNLPLVTYTVTNGPSPGALTAGSHYIWSQVTAYGSGTVVGTVAVPSGPAQFTIFQSGAGGGPSGPVSSVAVIPKTCPTSQAVNAVLVDGSLNCIVTTASKEIAFGFNNSPSVLTAQTACGVVTYTGTITGINMITDVTGTATVDIYTVALASYTGIAGIGSYTEIANGGVTMTGVTYYNNTTLTSWTKAITATAAAPKVVCFALSSPSLAHTLSGKLTLTAAQ
jgi:hypothetical protein